MIVAVIIEHELSISRIAQISPVMGINHKLYTDIAIAENLYACLVTKQHQLASTVAYYTRGGLCQPETPH